MRKKRVHWGKRDTKRKRKAEREYWGERDAESLVQWLNRKHRPARDPIEKLIRLHGEIGTPLRDVPREIQVLVRRLVADYKLAIAPVVGEVSRERWEISWRPAWAPGGILSAEQGLALIALVRLADQGFVRRVRECRFTKCQQWFFARSEHNPFFCSEKCKDRHHQSTPKWKKHNKERMRRYRQNLKDKAAAQVQARRKLKAAAQAQARRKQIKEDDALLVKRHPRFAAHIKTKRWHG